MTDFLLSQIFISSIDSIYWVFKHALINASEFYQRINCKILFNIY